MHTLKKNKSWIPLVCLVICGLAFSVKAGVTTTPKARYTGKQLFEGIFFGRGPVAEKLPAIRHILNLTDVRLSSSQELSLQKGEDDFITKLDDKCPGLLNTLETQIQSGDYLKVEKTLNETLRQIGKVFPSSVINADHSNTTSVDKGVIVLVVSTTATMFDIDIEVNLISAKSPSHIYLNLGAPGLKEETIVNEIVANL